jgi:hypothetical protein
MSSITVQNPGVAGTVENTRPAARLARLQGAKVGFVDNSKLNADIFLGRLKPLLARKYGIALGNTVRKSAPKDALTDPERAQLADCHAVVQCFGDCGASTSMSVTDGVTLEQSGVPTVTVCSTAFAGAARNQAVGRGLAELPLVEIPHPMHTAPRATVEQRADAAADSIARALLTLPDAVVVARDHDEREHFLLDSTAGLHEFLFERGWTDGLPVVPPTAEAVAAMLAAVKRAPGETVGPIPPRMRVGTIEKCAVNAVMAGCRPEYFPVVLAALDAVLDPAFRLYQIQTATNTSSPLLIINGPVVQQLGFNARGNVFGQGCRANATVGRAVQLILRNIGGEVPGETDMSTQGHAGKVSFCIAENEAENPWGPLHVELGFDAADSTVTAIGGSSPQNIFTYGCETGQDIMEHLLGALTALGHNNIIFPTGPLLVLSPEHAGTLARDGYTKASIKEEIFRRARIPLTRFAPRTAAGLHHRRERWFEIAGDPDHIGVADRAEDIHVIVAGGAGIHSQFVPTSFSYHAVTRRIGA